MLSAKKVLYAIFFSGEGVWQYRCQWKRAKSITGKYYKDVVLKKLKKYYQKRHPVMVSNMLDFYMINAPAHTSANVTNFLAKREGNSFTTPSLFTRPCPLWLLPFSKIENLPRWMEISVQTGAWICHTYLLVS